MAQLGARARDMQARADAGDQGCRTAMGRRGGTEAARQGPFFWATGRSPSPRQTMRSWSVCGPMRVVYRHRGRSRLCGARSIGGAHPTGFTLAPAITACLVAAVSETASRITPGASRCGWRSAFSTTVTHRRRLPISSEWGERVTSRTPRPHLDGCCCRRWDTRACRRQGRSAQRGKSAGRFSRYRRCPCPGSTALLATCVFCAHGRLRPARWRLTPAPPTGLENKADDITTLRQGAPMMPASATYRRYPPTFPQQDPDRVHAPLFNSRPRKRAEQMHGIQVVVFPQYRANL